MAVLVAAVFWTWLWGPIGLLLSTPLTVCVVVVGRYVPRLEFLGILFGDEPVLSPVQRFYQRMIALDADEAAELTEQLLKDQALAEVYDGTIIPALSLAEEGRHSGFLDATVEEYFLENTRELVEYVGSHRHEDGGRHAVFTKLICLPAKDAADEVAARMLVQLLPDTISTQVLPSGMSMDDIVQTLSSQDPDIVCVSGVPPETMRQVALQCKHLRKRFPELTIMAAVWSTADLSSIRSRIPVTDATHVVRTLRQALDYVAPNANPVAPIAANAAPVETKEAEVVAEPELREAPEGPLQDVLDRVTREAARALDAPIAMLNVVDDEGNHWNSQCGLPADLDLRSFNPAIGSDGGVGPSPSAVMIDDILQDDRLATDPFLREKGIHFYADAPLVTRSGKVVGSIRVLDTRPRHASDRERESLRVAATAAIDAVEIRTVAPSEEAEQSLHE